MNIAICDDNEYIVNRLLEIVSDCFGDDPNAFSCDPSYAGEDLLEELKEAPLKYQIYLLDIEMDQIDGMETAAQIRKHDSDAVIIFITSHNELMQQAFEVAAFHFLIKPLDEAKARQVLLKAIEHLNVRQTLFQYVIRKKIYTIYLHQILYFESALRKIIIHTTDESFEYYGTLKDVLTRVNPRLFAQAHNSYVINMEYVKTVDHETLILQNGFEIPITKKYSRDFHAAYRNFALMRMT